MATVLLNGDISGVEYTAHTWGALLDVLDTECAASGTVVTTVRLADLEVPAFRTAEARSLPMSADVQVFVDTARPIDLILQTLDEADAASRSIADAAVALGASYRAGDVLAASHALPGFAESLGTLIVVTATVAEGAGVDLSACGDGTSGGTPMVDTLLAHTDALLAARQAGDWARVADALDPAIATTVARWPHLLQAIRAASPVLAGAV